MKILPLFSIIIPSYNKGNFIKETLASVMTQTFSEWECIVVDDNSSDDSILIVEKFVNDSRIKLVKRGDSLKGGGSACRNLGIKHAIGKYIIFLDADDVLETDCLKSRLHNIERHSKNDFWIFPIGTFYKKIGDSSSVWTPKGENFLFRFLAHDLPWHTMSVVWKKDPLNELGGFDPEYPRLQDVELHTRALLMKKSKYKAFPTLKPDAFYRIDQNRIIEDMAVFLNKWILGAVMYIDKTKKLIDKNQTKSLKTKKQLKGTVLATMRSLLYHYVTNQVDDRNFNNLKDQLLLSKGVKTLFTKKDYVVTNVYILAYKKGFYKIKGFNFAAKKIISL